MSQESPGPLATVDLGGRGSTGNPRAWQPLATSQTVIHLARIELATFSVLS